MAYLDLYVVHFHTAMHFGNNNCDLISSVGACD